MSSERDFDRITRAWLDLMPNEAPDRAIDSVLQAVARTRQMRRSWQRATQRSPLMNRFILVAAVTALAAAMFGGAVFFAGSQTPRVVPPTASPSAGASPSPTLAVSQPFPSETWGDWLADVDTIPALGPAAPRIQLSIAWQDGQGAQLQTNVGDRLVLHSTSIAAPAGEVIFVASDATECPIRSEGHYGWNRSADGLFLTLTLIDDPCAVRATTLARPWVRSLGAVNDGRSGIVNYFDPAIQMTLPATRFAAGGGFEAADLTGDNGAHFIAVKDPAVFEFPCSQAGGSHVAGATVAAAFEVFLTGLPGFDVTTQDYTIDGLPAKRLQIATSADAPCDGGHVHMFAPSDLTDPASWSIRQGESDAIWLLEREGHVYLLQYHGTGVALADEESVTSTIHFIDTLPTP